MVAYSFQRQFVGRLVAGLEPGPWLPGMKRNTLRKPRAGRAPHARPEQPVLLSTGMRTKHYSQIGRAMCRLQMPVLLLITQDGLSIARRDGAAPRSKVADLAPIVQLLLSHPPMHRLDHEMMDEFARADGFADAAEMAAFFHAPAPSEVAGQDAMTLELVLIAWSPEHAG